MKRSCYFVSLGCPKNLVDSQVMLGMLEKDRYEIAKKPDNAEVIIVNTCSFIQAAKEESISTILDMATFKEEGDCKALVVSGCLAQRYAEDLKKEMPEVDLFIGTGQYHRITEFLDEQRKGWELGDPLPPRSYVDQPAFIHTESDPRMHTGPLYSAYLKLSEGCNRRCSFCIIPKLRGNVRSRTVASLVAETEALASRGVKELNLVAQDLTHYGIETRYEESLEKLLPALCRVEGIEWIRLHYVYPDQLSDEVIQIISREPKIVKYLDMPIQHTNDRVLGLMNRRLTKERLFEVVTRIRDLIPNVVFRTSIIVGFPGETEEEFRELKRDLVELNLDHVGVFRYSKEEDTKAALLDEQVHPSTRRRRQKELQEALLESQSQTIDARVGTRVPAIVEGLSEESDLLLQGRLSFQAPEVDGHVLINDVAEGLDVGTGDLVEVEISETMPGSFVGRAERLISKWGGQSDARMVN